LNTATVEKVKERCRGWHLDAIALASLLLFHIVNNWIWAVSNVTLLGWDRSSHLAKTLIYNDILGQINVRTIFTALTWPWNRPPLPFLTVVPFYRLFGTSTDVALMSNCVYLGILLCSVYGIGRVLYDRRVGLLAAFLVSFYPVLFAISRLSYVDYALTAMVSLAIYLLLKTDGFRNRKWSLLLGLGLGLGLLTKWPFIAFAGAPVVYVVWRSGALKDVLFVPWGGSEGITGIRRLLTSPWFHITVALLLSLAWYVPNWDRLPEFLLGRWIPLLAWILLACTFYVLSRKRRQGTNLLSAVVVGATIGSVWSLPNVGFSGRFVFVAYGGVNIQGKGLSLLDPTFYGRYLSMMLTEQLSPLFFVALLIGAGVLVYAAARRGSLRASWRQMSDGAWILTLWFTLPFLVFTLSQTWNSRFDIALLPAAALVTARGLLQIRARPLRAALVALIVICGMGQFFVLSYDDLYGVSEKTIVGVPVLGDLNLLGEGAYIMPPSRGRTDSGYWAAPEILGSIEEATTGESELALLVNNTHLNADILRYLTLLEYGDIEVRDLARDESGPSVYHQMFSSDYVLLSTHDPYKLSDGAKEAVQKMRDPSDVFQQLYVLREEFEFPDGEAVFLYEKRLPSPDEQIQDYYRHLIAALEPTVHESDAIILNPAGQIHTFIRFYDGPGRVYLLPQGDPAHDRQALQQILATHDRIHVVFRREDEADPEHLVENWLNERAHRAKDEWYGDIRLVLYAAPGSAPSIEGSVNANLGNEITLMRYTVGSESIAPEQILRVTLFWQARGEVAEDYVAFVHLLDDEGRLTAQRDGQPVGGSRPTSTWPADDVVSDNQGLLIPEGTPPGEYRLIAGMYLADTGERLLVLDERGQASGDAVFLHTIRVVAENEPAG